MIGLIQRVSRASVEVDGVTIGAIDQGLLALVCAERGDTTAQAEALLIKILGYRVFSDAQGKMNHSLTHTGGGLLLVPQFTLAADTRSGTRPSFTPAAAPSEATVLFDAMLVSAKKRHPVVQSGRFGADMQVSLINNGPVTFWLRVDPPSIS